MKDETGMSSDDEEVTETAEQWLAASSYTIYCSNHN